MLEMDSIICKWVQCGVVTPTEGSDVRDALRQYPLQHHSFVSFLDSAFAIANQTRHSIYDCLYVALAALLKGKTVTADRKLYNDLMNGPFKKHIVWVADIV